MMTQNDLHRAFVAIYYEEVRRAARRTSRPADGTVRGLAQPVQYDESGLPISAGSPTVAERLRRLLLG